MNVTFDVTGRNVDDLESMARQMLNRFGPRMWQFQINAEPSIRSGEGEVLMWRGEVEAHD